MLRLCSSVNEVKSKNRSTLTDSSGGLLITKVIKYTIPRINIENINMNHIIMVWNDYDLKMNSIESLAFKG